ncbi:MULTISPECIES: nucleotidyltransferase family protein [unclassified Rhizobium]|uniref:nucleotidyltransferase family protein n=1 Tax=unclassified Rhizobium TaxID=2613769 RepID=UPI0017862EDE|nr:MULTISPECIES: nucleotidyltransferase family protein [unclassified Rhizobium]MBD8689372.1 nucleotidyltransferase family protein [Rhizobium sp. CFBP 13644]MBD8693869.1 nucleotidyltransferase family protein [Rhizobium sp. CFBP 13717]
MGVAIVLLAAGMSSRTAQSGAHKLLAEFDGIPLLRKMAMIAGQSNAASVTVVLGHRHEEIGAVLDGLEVALVVNANHALGMASSIASGLSVPQAKGADGVMVMLADMPKITGEHLKQMIATFEHTERLAIVRAVADGKPGNPVILPRAMFEDLSRLEGDVGARDLIKASGLQIIDVELGSAALMDVDTPEAIASAGGILAKPSSVAL